MSRFASPNAKNGGVPLPKWAIKRRPLEFLADCPCVIEGVNFINECAAVSDWYQKLNALPRMKYRTAEQETQADELVNLIAAHKLGRRKEKQAVKPG